MSEAERIARAYRELEATAGSRWDLSNPGNQMVLAERRAQVRRLLDSAGWIPLGDRRVLDVGCGGGAELAWLLELGASPARLVGIDLLPGRITSAKRAFPQLEFHNGNAEQLEFPDASFDMVVAFTIFSSILDPTMARRVASEMVRVMRPGGGLLWYDFRFDNPANRNVRGVSDARVHQLFAGLEGDLHKLTVLPPLVRRLGPLARPLYPVLSAVAPLRSHLLGLLRKPS